MLNNIIIIIMISMMRSIQDMRGEEYDDDDDDHGEKNQERNRREGSMVGWMKVRLRLPYILLINETIHDPSITRGEIFSLSA